MKIQGEYCIVTTMKIIGSKWTAVILYELFEGTKRFGELQKAIKGISPKILSTRLKNLENQGIIKRKTYNEIPLHVEYSLTKRGESLNNIMEQMYRWGEQSLQGNSKAR